MTDLDCVYRSTPEIGNGKSKGGKSTAYINREPRFSYPLIHKLTGNPPSESFLPLFTTFWPFWVESAIASVDFSKAGGGDVVSSAKRKTITLPHFKHLNLRSCPSSRVSLSQCKHFMLCFFREFSFPLDFEMYASQADWDSLVLGKAEVGFVEATPGWSPKGGLEEEFMPREVSLGIRYNWTNNFH